LNPPPYSSTSGRPLVNLSLALNYHFGQLDPVGYHAFNVVVHVLSALVLWAIVRRTLRLEYFAGRFDRVSGPLALAVALVWALHPLQTEAVIYVTQRTELMMAFFYLATLYGSLRYWAADSPHRRTAWLAVATVSCLAGMLCKEVMVSAPVMVLLFDRTFISGSFREAWRKSWPLYVGLASGWLLLVYLNYGGPRSDTAGFGLGVPAHVWWFTQAKVLWMYLTLTVWPWPLVIHYELPYLATFSAAWRYVVPVVVLAVATLFLLWRRHPVGYLAACVFAVLAPTLLVPIVTEVAAERRMYLPLAALVTLVVVGGYAVVEKAAWHLGSHASGPVSGARSLVLVVTVAMMLASVGGVVSAHRLAAYHDELTLWQDTLTHNPDNYIAHNNLANQLLAAGHTDDAVEHYEQAVALNHDYVAAHFNLGNVLAESGRCREAIGHYEEALRLDPDYPEAYANMASAYALLGQSAEALAAAQKGLDIARSTRQTAATERIAAWLAAYRATLPDAHAAAPNSESQPSAP
jgi:tetratricopeptide (TPR) repeat protein